MDTLIHVLGRCWKMATVRNPKSHRAQHLQQRVETVSQFTSNTGWSACKQMRRWKLSASREVVQQPRLKSAFDCQTRTVVCLQNPNYELGKWDRKKLQLSDLGVTPAWTIPASSCNRFCQAQAVPWLYTLNSGFLKTSKCNSLSFVAGRFETEPAANKAGFILVIFTAAVRYHWPTLCDREGEWGWFMLSLYSHGKVCYNENHT